MIDSSRLQWPWRIGIDVGGTFTDLVIVGKDDSRFVFKSPSTPEVPAQGVIDVLKCAAAAHELTLVKLLGGCEQIIHGSTVATNTLLESKGSKVGLLCTDGFRDSLEIRRGMRADVWNHRLPFAPVLVPRYLRLPVRERIDKDGNVLTALQLEDVLSAINTFKNHRVQTIAVCLLHACANPIHEQAVLRVLLETLKNHEMGRWICLSSEVVPVIGEYERCSTTVVNAYLAPRVSSYLLDLFDRLRKLGLKRPLFVQQSNGGVLAVEQAATRPVNLLLSGPAAGVGALSYFAGTTNARRLISMEIGGTSTDVMVMTDGVVGSSEGFDIAGYSITAPAVDIHTVGAGGGTFATVDHAGMISVGPQGAGAVPGPVSYGRGGVTPTVTDAHLVLGRLRPGLYAGGTVKLDLELASQAIEKKIAIPLNISVQQAAAGIIRLANQRMTHAVEKISIQRGIDAREYILVACGGAGPMHGIEVARNLNIKTVHVPRQSGAFCAFGMLNSDLRQEFERPVLEKLTSEGVQRVAEILLDLTNSARRFLIEEGFEKDVCYIRRQTDLRYVGQQWSVRVELEPGDQETTIRGRFEAEYQRLFGHRQPQGTIELTNLRVIAEGRMIKVAPLIYRAPTSEKTDEYRPVFFESINQIAERTKVFQGGEMVPGIVHPGPLIVEEATTTIVVSPRDILKVDQFGDYSIHINAAMEQLQ